MFIFFSLPDPSRTWKLCEYCYFHGHIIICIYSVKIFLLAVKNHSSLWAKLSVACLVTDFVCVCVLVTQSCPTLCNLMDCSPTGSFVQRTPQARILECVAIPFSGDLLVPRNWIVSSGLWAGSLLSELPGKPKPWPLIICINIWAVLMGLMHGLKTG